MLKDSLNNHYKNKHQESIICKDGFCSLPNQKETSKQDTNDMNLFDPI